MNNNKNYRIMKFFEASDKACTGKGYVRIDMRGNRGQITVNIENLGDGKAPSEVFLFKNKNEKIKIGTINNKKGRLQKSIMLNGKDEPLENYNVCAIVSEDKILMYAPVFTDTQATQLNQLLEEATPITEENNLQCEDKLEDTFEEAIIAENIVLNKTKEDENNQDTCQAEAQIQEPPKKQKSEYEKKLYTLLNEFEQIKPLAQDIQAISWWKIIYDENSIYKGFLPYFNQIITTYYPYPLSNRVTTCQSLMQRHGYYLFGIYEDNASISKFVYGIPGKFTRDEQPYRGVTGFKNWSYKSNEIAGDYGYWIAFIDANTGAVTDPPNIE